MSESRTWLPGSTSRCLCCKAEFVFAIDSGGLCEVCNEGECPQCGRDVEGWLYG